jgi:hypothetical protein
MLCYSFPWPWVPACSAKVFSYLEPLLHLMDHITFCVFPHTTEQDSQPTTVLISKQVVPYQTCGGNCCLGMSTPKTRSLVDSSMINHITWRISTISSIPILTQTTTSILSTVNSHLDRRKTNTLNINTSQTQHHKDGRLARLSRLHG